MSIAAHKNGQETKYSIYMRQSRVLNFVLRPVRPPFECYIDLSSAPTGIENYHLEICTRCMKQLETHEVVLSLVE